MYPTLVDIAGITVDTEFDGKSLVPLLNGSSDGKGNVAYSQFPRCLNGRNYASLPLDDGDREVWEVYNDGIVPTWREPVEGLPEWKLTNCDNVEVGDMSFMGMSVRTGSWRYTAWYRMEGGKIKWEEGTGGREEMYQYYWGDTDIFEAEHNYRNVVNHTEFTADREMLRGLVEQQWRNL